MSVAETQHLVYFNFTQLLMKYGCPVEVTLKRMGGKWKSVILWWLRQNPKSFGELKHLIPGISSKVLTQQLRELEEDGLVHRENYREVPRRVEYSITPFGATLRPIVELMCEWGKNQMPEFRFGLLDLTGLRVLVMSPEMDDFLRSELESRGVQVAIATSISRALTDFDQIQPQALVIDTELPDNQAYTLIRHIKALEPAPAQKIATIALTPATRFGDRRQALRSGFQVCLTKPVDTAELAASLASLVGFLNG
ncbi:winged helix-turn-helix transcriptional regulator [Leptolyngbya sp. 'hensonii']|uniref:winged helix-turn-helix transcriptional regulator n=1 Tax=Leptolyngbya sp. 'hensonii' TaxID=1922337 RepID=UPI0015C52A56|nr:winged helix-turn-helix transcriptional regulator [Leptolyngbya sp. 'hensonii']